MVRLEKIVYEKVVNSNALNRARKITTPHKWNATNPHEHMSLLAYNFFERTFLGRLVKPIYEKYWLFEKTYHRDVLLQQGLTFEDRFLHHDRQLRRNMLFEHMARESLHPYHWVLKVKRRERFFKVERGLRGFFVPDYVRNQAKSQSYQDYQRLKKQWATFTHNNYYSDMTPSAHRTVIPRLFLLELPLNYGIMRPEAWSRYFMNERDNALFYSQKDLQIVRDRRKFPHDLTTAEGKRNFEKQFNEINEKSPGLVAPEGQKFDFKAYYNEIGV